VTVNYTEQDSQMNFSLAKQRSLKHHQYN